MEPDLEMFSDEEARFRLDACLKQMLGKPLSASEADVIADVRRRNGWDRDTDRNGEADETPQVAQPEG